VGLQPTDLIRGAGCARQSHARPMLPGSVRPASLPCRLGAPVGAAREELLTIDQIEQGHWLAASGMDDVPVIDHMAVLAAAMRSPAAQCHQRYCAEKTFEPIVPRVRLRRPEDRLKGEHAGDDRSEGTE